MSLVLNCPTAVSVPLLSTWIDAHCLSLFDVALCNKSQRQIFSNLTTAQSFTHLGNDSFVGGLYLRWLSARNIKVRKVFVKDIGDELTLRILIDLITKHSLTHFQMKNVAKVDLKETMKHLKECGDSLVNVGFIDCSVDSESMASIIESCPNITTVDFSGSGGVTDDVIRKLQSVERKMDVLNLNSCPISAECLESCSKWTSVTKLGLKGNPNLTPQVLGKLLSSFQQLLVLNISDLSPVEEGLFAAVATHCTSLQALYVSEVDVKDADLIPIATSCTELQVVDLTGCVHISDEAVIKLAKSCNLKKLCLGRVNKVSNNSIIALGECCQEMRYLDINYCYKVNDAALMGLAVCCRQLEYLDISFCFRVTDHVIAKIAEQCTELSELHAACCDRITDASLITLSELCTGTLRHLNIAGCLSLSDAAIMAVAVCCIGLRYLDVSDNGELTDVSLWKIVTCCHKLTHLNVSYCKGISDEMIANVKQAFPHLHLSCLIYRHV